MDVIRHDDTQLVQKLTEKLPRPLWMGLYFSSVVSIGETEPLKNQARRFLWMGSVGVFAAHEAPTTRGC